MIDCIVLVGTIANFIFAICLRQKMLWIHNCLGWFTAILLAVKILIK